MAEAGDVILPSNFNIQKKDLAEKFIKAKRNSVLKGNRNVWELSQISVEPEYQGKGIGRRLVEEGLKLADSDNLLLYLEATPCGKLLYEKLGFDLMEETDFPGVVDQMIDYRTYFMMKNPGAAAR
ncbi:hypothetical protein EJ04DRAFT_579892 [Polyplosphaeria fusca]|uniref:N-acetyltransferase domain-containing protein n=1 Tax=Polyplosphaeria fusca TaxID=682080 RepID=A0A9P4UXJ9_9PLEO|nr:hypothetical protein EJ04DRAFT_579892 [Polyplosphaeria fusca]